MLDVKWDLHALQYKMEMVLCMNVCACANAEPIYSVQQCLIFLTRHKLFLFSYSADWWTPGSGARRL